MTRPSPLMPAFDHPSPHIRTSSPLNLHVIQYFVPGWNTRCPPHPHNFCFRGFTENNTHRRDGCLLKSNEFFGERDSHPSLSKCNKPQW